MYKHSSLFLLGESHIKPIHCKSKGLLANSQSHSRKGLKFGVTKQTIFAWKRGPFGVKEICIFLLLQKAYWFGRCGGPEFFGSLFREESFQLNAAYFFAFVTWGGNIAVWSGHVAVWVLAITLTKVMTLRNIQQRLRGNISAIHVQKSFFGKKGRKEEIALGRPTINIWTINNCQLLCWTFKITRNLPITIQYTHQPILYKMDNEKLFLFDTRNPWWLHSNMGQILEVHVVKKPTWLGRWIYQKDHKSFHKP